MDHSLDDLADAIEAVRHGSRVSNDRSESVPVARPDYHREERKGVPEIILAEPKSVDHVIAITRSFLDSRGRAIISRVPDAMRETLRVTFAEQTVVDYGLARMVVVRRPGVEIRSTGGRVGIVTAGTSDMPAAEEAKAVLIEMGCAVHDVFDVGVAGIHRLFEPLNAMLAEGVDVVIVAAGMDGALPSVVAGLVDVPVIGLPTSTGYGFGGKGVGALTTMLQTCSPGLAVVNIDNGVGAAAMAGLIANRVARARTAQKDGAVEQITEGLAGRQR